MTPETQLGSASGVQYQHYIPRFILRTFLETQDPPRTSKQRSKEYWKARKKGVELEPLNVYDISTNTLESRPIAKSFGENNLYTDITDGIHSQHVEVKLSRLENEAAQVITTIQNSLNKGTFVLTRRSLEVLRKFVFIMHLREPRNRSMYFNPMLDDRMSDWIHQYMRTHNIQTWKEIWLHALAYYLDTPHSAIVAEGERIHANYTPAQWTKMLSTKVDPDVGNWFACDYEALANSHYFGVWEAAPGHEFVLGSNSFGLWEGLVFGSPSVHRIFVISPRLALVLRNNVLRGSSGAMARSMVTSSLADIPTPPPITKYGGTFRTAKALAAHRTTPAAQKDTYTYRATKLTEKQTKCLNNVILLNVPQNGFLVFSSKRNVVKAIESYILTLDAAIKFGDPYERYAALVTAIEDTLAPSDLDTEPVKMEMGPEAEAELIEREFKRLGLKRIGMVQDLMKDLHPQLERSEVEAEAKADTEVEAAEVAYWQRRQEKLVEKLVQSLDMPQTPVKELRPPKSKRRFLLVLICLLVLVLALLLAMRK